MPAWIVTLITTFGPMFAAFIKRYQDSHNGNFPDWTDASIQVEFHTNIDKYLLEGEQWTSTHPNV